MNAFQIIWRDLTGWMRRKRIFAVDVDTYETLRRVAERENCTPQEAAVRLLEQAARDQNDRDWALECWEQLSPRQKQITAHVCRGDSTRQMAAELTIAQTTVKSHVEIILRKFGLNSRAALRQTLSRWDLSAYL